MTDTYQLAIYSYIDGPLLLETNLTLEEVLTRSLTAIQEHDPYLIESMAKTLKLPTGPTAHLLVFNALLDKMQQPNYNFHSPHVKLYFKENPSTNDWHLHIVSFHHRDRENELTIFAKKLN